MAKNPHTNTATTASTKRRGALGRENGVRHRANRQNEQHR